MSKEGRKEPKDGRMERRKEGRMSKDVKGRKNVEGRKEGKKESKEGRKDVKAALLVRVSEWSEGVNFSLPYIYIYIYICLSFFLPSFFPSSLPIQGSSRHLHPFSFHRNFRPLGIAGASG